MRETCRGPCCLSKTVKPNIPSYFGSRLPHGAMLTAQHTPSRTRSRPVPSARCKLFVTSTPCTDSVSSLQRYHSLYSSKRSPFKVKGRNRRKIHSSGTCCPRPGSNSQVAQASLCCAFFHHFLFSQLIASLVDVEQSLMPYTRYYKNRASIEVQVTR